MAWQQSNGSRGATDLRALLQRVTQAKVTVEGKEIAAIDHGLLVLVGVLRGDAEADAERLARRTLAARIFADERKPLNRSVVDVDGAVLAVSQFTLAADIRRGNRPGFGHAAVPEAALKLYGRYVETLRAHCRQVQTGEFGAHMQIALVNDGPVTILLDTATGETST